MANGMVTKYLSWYTIFIEQEKCHSDSESKEAFLWMEILGTELHVWDSGFLESIIQWNNPPAARYHPWLSGPESTSDLSPMHMGCNCLELITVQ